VNAIEGGTELAYAAAKAGQVKLMRPIAVQLGEDKVNVYCISPGYVKRPIQD
jgi:NAD(P)-dependent dehydrogenase (short-subunit alcohol dehydrogenase family)